MVYKWRVALHGVVGLFRGLDIMSWMEWDNGCMLGLLYQRAILMDDALYVEMIEEK